MQRATALLTLVFLVAAGCSEKATTPAPGAAGAATSGAAPQPGGTNPATANAPDPGATAVDPGTSGAANSLQPVPIVGQDVVLNSGNTKLEFVGTHVGAKPDPRTGGFERFAGKAEFNADKSALTALWVDIETNSVWTQIGGQLTSHLKTPDFLDTGEFPTASFASRSIVADPSGPDRYKVSGELTLHGVSKQISFVATIHISAAGLTLDSQFTLDRTEFNMTWGQERVQKEVSMTIQIGQQAKSA